MSSNSETTQSISLLHAFRDIYHRFARAAQEAVEQSPDSIVLTHLYDDLQEYRNILSEVYCLYLAYLK